jgi:two-component system NtrC family sensor kinase
VLLEEQGDSATQVAALKIRTAAERCARIVRTFLAMARQQQPERGPVAINEVVTAALDIASYAIRTSSIEVSLDLADDIPLILADADQLHQVLLNLIINAQQSLQESPGARRIVVTSRFDAGAGYGFPSRVADNGAGIPEHLRARVFEPYFTTQAYRDRHRRRAGREPRHCRSARRHDHRRLPAPVAAPNSPSRCRRAPSRRLAATLERSRSERGAAEPPHDLVVDDEPEIRDALAEILTSAEPMSSPASSGREALDRLAAENYDVILTDIRNAGPRRARAVPGRSPKRWPAGLRAWCFVTGDTLTTALREFVNDSGRPVIEKPFLPSEVRRVVAELVRG